MFSFLKDKLKGALEKISKKIEQAPAPEQMPKHTSTNQPESEVSEGNKSMKTIRKMSTNSGSDKSRKVSTKEETKLGRNDPCWCGSGKKFKKCHFPEMG